MMAFFSLQEIQVVHEGNTPRPWQAQFSCDPRRKTLFGSIVTNWVHCFYFFSGLAQLKLHKIYPTPISSLKHAELCESDVSALLL